MISEGFTAAAMTLTRMWSGSSIEGLGMFLRVNSCTPLIMLAWSALIFDTGAETLLSRLEWQALVVSKSTQTVLKNARFAVGIEATVMFLALT